MAEHAMTINGAPVVSADRFDVLDPATEEVCGQAPDCTAAELDAAMAAAHDAFGPWRADPAARTAALLAGADALEAAGDELAALLTAEQGKPLAEARREVVGGGIWLRWSAMFDDPPEVLQDDDAALVRIVRKPLGPVAAIVPWNFPLMIALQTIAPALASGNTVVLKPSPFTPLTTLAMGRLLGEALPPGVLNVVSGGDELGAAMTAHPLARKVQFTGSVATGKKVAAAAAPDLKRLSLELGGNDPGIVLDDVDVDAIADRLFWSAFTNNGQICIAIKRLYVTAARHDDVVEALAERAKAVRVGPGTDPASQLGPVNNRPQHERVAALVADALDRGAHAAAGGARIDGPGLFFEPTILAGADDGMRIVDEEQFGPALPIVKVRDAADAVARANRSHFGLGASVWTSDLDRGQEVALQLESGGSWVNTHLAVRPSIPMGGVKWSGIGVAFGRDGYRSFTEPQVVHCARG